ncbi:hypothetical protein VitviT2T_018272 [Vitis vinifera]|uniref:Uncharacterized protein n=1 Tax=Vitis vinifera TaxID=29760 RepID=A0ABY9D013_VITVI|nr:hypothetical protein VitviT2T_018272 [Vitis vinifera]
MIFNGASSTPKDSQKLQELKIEPHQFHQQLHHSYRKFDKPSEAQPTGHTLRLLFLPKYKNAVFIFGDRSKESATFDQNTVTNGNFNSASGSNSNATVSRTFPIFILRNELKKLNINDYGNAS